MLEAWLERLGKALFAQFMCGGVVAARQADLATSWQRRRLALMRQARLAEFLERWQPRLGSGFGTVAIAGGGDGAGARGPRVPPAVLSVCVCV